MTPNTHTPGDVILPDGTRITAKEWHRIQMTPGETREASALNTQNVRVTPALITEDNAFGMDADVRTFNDADEDMNDGS